MKIELTDNEVTTIMVALDNYGEAKRAEWMESRADPDAPDDGQRRIARPKLVHPNGAGTNCLEAQQTVPQFNR